MSMGCESAIEHMSEDSELAKSGGLFNKDDDDSKKVERLLKEGQKEGAPDDSLRVELNSLIDQDTGGDYFLKTDRFICPFFLSTFFFYPDPLVMLQTILHFFVTRNLSFSHLLVVLVAILLTENLL